MKSPSSEEQTARSAFELASSKLRPGVTMKEGGAKWESRYATAYQGLVRHAGAPQLRRRYRP